VDGGRGSVVRISPEEGSLYGLAKEPVAAWHFETAETVGGGRRTAGARNRPATLQGNMGDLATPLDDFIVAGRLGRAFLFNGTDDYVDCGTYPAYNRSGGIRMETYVLPLDENSGANEPVMVKSNWSDSGYALWLRTRESGGVYRHQVRARFYLEDGNVVDVETRDSVWADHLEHGQAAHVAAEYDGFEARLYVNGVLKDLDSFRDNEDENPIADPNTDTNEEFNADSGVEPATESLYIGGDPNEADYFEGRIDEPRLLSVAGGEPIVLPNRVVLWTSEGAIYFDAQGALDIARHSQPIYVAVGDPYRLGELAADLDDTDTSLTLTLEQNFWGGEGYVLVGEDDDYELLYYGDVAGEQLQQLEPGVENADRDSHLAGEEVYFARVVRVSLMGLISRLD
jgi:hypothetical protein